MSEVLGVLRVNMSPDMACYSPWQLCKSFCYCLPSNALLIKLLLQAIVLLLKSSTLSIWPPTYQKWLCQGYQRTSSVPHHTVSVDLNEMHSEKQLRWVWSGEVIKAVQAPTSYSFMVYSQTVDHPQSTELGPNDISQYG